METQIEKKYIRKVEDERIIRLLTAKTAEEMPNLPYHNFEHALDVYSMAVSLAYLEELNYDNFASLRKAAISHDYLVVPGRKDNEERSARIISSYLFEIGDSEEEIERVSNLILATRLPQNPKNLAEAIICDADLDNLGREDCIELGEYVRMEAGIPREKWYSAQLGFLKNHKYWTESERRLRDEGKMRNIEMLERLIRGERVDELELAGRER